MWTETQRYAKVPHWLRAHVDATDGETRFRTEEIQSSQMPAKTCENRPTHWPMSGTLVLYYPQHSVDHGIRPCAPVLLRVLKGHMDLQLVASGEEAVENVLKTVQYTTKPGPSLGFDALLSHDNGYSPARAVVDSYRLGHGEIMMGLLRGPGLHVHAQTNFTKAKNAPTFSGAAEHGVFHCQVVGEIVASWIGFDGKFTQQTPSDGVGVFVTVSSPAQFDSDLQLMTLKKGTNVRLLRAMTSEDFMNKTS